MTSETPDRLEALLELLEEPDPPDLHRGHVRRLEGKPERFEMYQTYPMRAVVHAHVARDNERGL